VGVVNLEGQTRADEKDDCSVSQLLAYLREDDKTERDEGSDARFSTG